MVESGASNCNVSPLSSNDGLILKLHKEAKWLSLLPPLRFKYNTKTKTKTLGSGSLNKLFQDLDACTEQGAHCSKASALSLNVLGLQKAFLDIFFFVHTSLYIVGIPSASVDLILGLKTKLK